MSCLKLCVVGVRIIPRNHAQHSVQETDKATIDVEAQEDGILGKILVREFYYQGLHGWLIPNTQAQDGTKNVPVGRIIALLAEEGDDISNLQLLAEEAKPEPAKQPPPSESEAPKSESFRIDSSHSLKHFRRLLLIYGSSLDLVHRSPFLSSFSNQASLLILSRAGWAYPARC